VRIGLQWVALSILGATVPVLAQPSCAPLPAPTGTVIEVYPGDAGQLKSLINSSSVGTTILLHDGFYDMSSGGSSQLTFWNPGVTMRSYSGNRGAVILDGDYVTGELVSIYASDVTIADLTLRRAYYHPIHISGQQNSPISGVRIHNVRVVDPGEQAIKINPVGNGWVDEGVIECSSIELTPAGRSQIRNNCYTGGIDAHAARGWTVRRNRIEGFWCNSGLSEHGVHFWRASRDTLVEQNVIVDCARGVGFGLGPDGGTRAYPDDPYPGVSNKGHIDGVIRNNFIAATDPSLFLSQYGFDTGVGLEQAAGARVLHNSVASSQSPASSSIEWRFGSTFADVANNLTTGRLLARNGAQATLQGNIPDALASWFEDLGSGDLHLTTAGAAAVDAGASLPAGWTGRDFDHQTRDTDPDVGADEQVDPIFSDGFEGGLGPWIVAF
jgi:hypothetical protein